MSSEKRKPNWTLCVKESDASPWRAIGAAWETEKGNLYVKLNDGEVLKGAAMFFPYRDKPVGGGWNKKPYRAPVEHAPAKRAPYTPPTKPDAPSPHEPDYMERKRAERHGAPPLPGAPSPSTAAFGADDDENDPLDVEPPDWL